jgi:hypothetical protein
MSEKDLNNEKNSEESDLEGHIVPDELKKIRDRAFDDEFKGLVDRITQHEEEDVEGELDRIPPEERGDVLLKKYHELFYKSGNLMGVSHINYNFSPFIFQESLPGSLIHNITNRFNKISLGRFAILHFDIEKNCFRPAINYISDIEESQIIVNMYEELHQRILQSDYGIILDQGQIDDDIYLKKRFSFKEEYLKDNLFYFLSLKKFFSEFIDELNLGEFGGFQSIPLFPILIIQLRVDSEKVGTEEIYGTIKNSMIMQLILYCIELYRKISEIELDTLEQLIGMLEFYLLAFSKIRRSSLIIIRLKQLNEIYMIFIIKHLLSKLNRLLTSKSVLSHLFSDRMLILAERSEVEVVMQVLKEFNEQFNLFDFKQLNLDQYMNFNDILNEYIFP